MIRRLFGKDVGVLEFARYGDGTTAMQFNTMYGEPLCRATVCLEGLGAPPLAPDQVWIKTWAENEGVLEMLEDSGVVVRDPNQPPFEASGNPDALAVMAFLTPLALAELEFQEWRA
jgi:hypothetical protein